MIAGAQNREEDLVLRDFMRAFVLLEVDYKVASEAAKFRRYSKARIPDVLIWGTAVAHGRVLLTRNTRDFNPDDARVSVPYRL